MKEDIDKRACELGYYILENRSTIRATAHQYGVSKSTVHKDLTERLYYANRTLYYKVKALLEYNKSQRHIRGGLETRKKLKGE